jgi:hypothetical protein
MPEEIVEIVFEFDGRWRKENGKWISIFHMSDERYWMLDNMIRWSKFNSYSYIGRRRRCYEHADRIGFIFPIVQKEDEETLEQNAEKDDDNVPCLMPHIYTDKIRYMHLNKIIVYGKERENSTNKIILKSKYNIMRAFSSSKGIYVDSSDDDCSDNDEYYISYDEDYYN